MAKNKDSVSGGIPEITRRDFVGGTLIGSGVALLSAHAPGLLAQGITPRGYQLKLGHSMPLPLTGLDESWTGPGGIGDYAVANGDTWREVNAGHAFIRNGDLAGSVAS
ncbi:MAG: hypothetical protein OEV88_17160, partial [Gammaproteobacteria bacterium]|nr:hypothetical protein [Gammaproteobacteria bacterium]